MQVLFKVFWRECSFNHFTVRTNALSADYLCAARNICMPTFYLHSVFLWTQCNEVISNRLTSDAGDPGNVLGAAPLDITRSHEAGRTLKKFIWAETHELWGGQDMISSVWVYFSLSTIEYFILRAILKNRWRHPMTIHFIVLLPSFWLSPVCH